MVPRCSDISVDLASRCFPASAAVNTLSRDPGLSKMGMNMAPLTDAAHAMTRASIKGGRRHRTWIFLLCRSEGCIWGVRGQPKDCSWGVACHLVLRDKVSHSTLRACLSGSACWRTSYWRFGPLYLFPTVPDTPELLWGVLFPSFAHF